MSYEIRAVKAICYADDRKFEDFELVFDDADDKTAKAFAVYERESDGGLRWVADFGDKGEADWWVRVMDWARAMGSERKLED